jgi:hypothetical protein
MNSSSVFWRSCGRSALTAGLLLALQAAGTAQVLLYEPFNYASSGPVSLAGTGATNTTGFDPTSTWSTFNTGNAPTTPIKVYNQGVPSGVNFSSGTANAYVGTTTNLPTSGGSVGPGGTNTTDHMIMWRTLDPSVTSSFVAGTTTWFSFVSVRGYDANPAGMKLALGKGALIEDRGAKSTGEAIGGGSGLGSSLLNAYKVYPQFWDATTGSGGETTGTFFNYDLGGQQPASTGGNVHVVPAPYFPYSDYTLPAGQTAGLDSMLLNNVAGVQGNGAINIVVGKIDWRDGTTPDVVSVVNFWDNAPLTETAFNNLITAQPNLSSANWPLANQPVLDQSKFDTLSLAGGKWFVDEVRLATTFNAAVGIAVVPEPSLLAALGVGVAGALGLYSRRRVRAGKSADQFLSSATRRG